MVRQVDERRRRAALRKLRRAARLAEEGSGPPLSEWELRFLTEVTERIDRYGGAFADPAKGASGEALSGLQQLKLREIDRKARGNRPDRRGGSVRRGPGPDRPVPESEEE